eukprot:TRINITY_DN31798_c0_g1_i1.p1 TRINITY_DN31798_c0_g1~~TRINITY_DN31798_c0_g1_i1.p1  ORF type:complete len:528 (+),score=40.99 TRINITY_DN31798_c0_g1_i1:77-1660(+)
MGWASERLAACALLAYAAGQRAGQDPHIVSEIPGWSGDLPAPMYAGHVNLPGTRKHPFYWLVLSEGDPAADPVVVVTDGGPVCSGVGLMWAAPGGSYGPFAMTEHRNGSVRVHLNPYRWSRLASVLFVESPVGVGYSFSDEPMDYSTVASDDRTSRDTLSLVRTVMARFPLLAAAPLYLHGMSYGGHFMPQLAARILAGEAPELAKRLKGMTLGNPATHLASADYFHGIYGKLASSNLLSVSGWAALRRECDDGNGYADWWARIFDAAANATFGDITPCGFPPSGKCLGVETGCSRAIRGATYTVCGKQGIIPGRIDNATACATDFYLLDQVIPFWNPENGSMPHPPVTTATYFPHPLHNPAHANPLLYAQGSGGALSITARYLNRTDVKRAVHTRLNATWLNCAPIPSQTWPLRDIYGREVWDLYPGLLRSGLSVLLYSGDNDAVVGSEATQRGVEALGYAKIGPWKAWGTDKVGIAGMYQQYEGLTYATVHSAGHDVHLFQPERLFELHRYYLAGNLTTPLSHRG